MSSPLSISGLLAAGFLLGVVPAGLFALCGPVAAHVGVEPVRFERWLRRGLFLPSIVFLPAAGWLADAWGARDVALLGLIILVVDVSLFGLIPAARAARDNLPILSAALSLFGVGTLAWMAE